MHGSGPLPLFFEGPKQVLEGKNCRNVSRGKRCAAHARGIAIALPELCSGKLKSDQNT